MWTQITRSKCTRPHNIFLLLGWMETLFAQVEIFVVFSQETPLLLSAMNGHLETCRLLLQCNADVDAKESGWLLQRHHFFYFMNQISFCVFCVFSFFCFFFCQHTPLILSADYSHSIFFFSSAKTLHCFCLLGVDTFNFAVFWSKARQMWTQITRSKWFRPHNIFLLLGWMETLFAQVEIFVVFSQETPLLLSAMNGHLETCRLLLQCNADVDAKESGWLLQRHHFFYFMNQISFCVFCVFSFFCFFFCQHTPLILSADYSHSIFFFSSAKTLHCFCLLGVDTFNFAVFWSRARQMWTQITRSKCSRPHHIFLLLGWMETLFAQVDSFAFLQSNHSSASVCFLW